MRWSQITECGPVRLRNEDWLCTYPELGFFAVADGMGGHRGGNVASKTLLNELGVFIKNNHAVLPPRELLAEGIRLANQEVYQSALQSEELRGMGSTLNACLMVGPKLYVANVGDSRALLLRGNKISKLTSDHSLVQELMEQGGITEEEALTHPRRNILTRALGTGPRVEVDLFEYNIEQGDRLLLCTDGLCGFVPHERIGRLMASSDDPEIVLKYLLQEAITVGSNDNITMIFLVVD